MISHERLTAAYARVQRDLLDARDVPGPWVGELASSSLATATAISALSIIQRQRRIVQSLNSTTAADSMNEDALDRLIRRGLSWLAAQQNKDGGWGDTPLSHSNIATTLLARAAFMLTGVPADQDRLLERADRFVSDAGGLPALKRRYGRDKTFAVPILTNCALAGMVPWPAVSALPFEMAVLPQRFYRMLRLPVVSYAIPALVAIGQAKYHFHKPLNPLTRWIRQRAIEPSLRILQRMQPDSGGYLEAIPLTSFVAMSLAAMRRQDHPVVCGAVRFLRDTVRPDGSWPIDTNLATWNTTLAINALDGEGLSSDERWELLQWLRNCQQTEVHPFTGAEPGGWGWSDLSGAVPDADDTPGALLALEVLYRLTPDARQRGQIEEAAAAGIKWLLNLQNRDGGWPTFCRGWGKLPFDRSGTDLTAHALRALLAWQPLGPREEITRALERGWAFLSRTQQQDGSWNPLWFGNQDHPAEENPVYGTSKVLLAYRDARATDWISAAQGRDFLLTSQNLDGGWGGGWTGWDPQEHPIRSSIEESSLAIEALLPWHAELSVRSSIEQGLSWLVTEVEAGRQHRCTPIGFYFAKLWYHEKLYPLTFAASALRRAARTWQGNLADRQNIVPTAS